MPPRSSQPRYGLMQHRAINVLRAHPMTSTAPGAGPSTPVFCILRMAALLLFSYPIRPVPC
jgi:hypothetical protein